MPLVEPAPALPEGEAARAARQLRLPELGDIGQRRLYNAKVAVMGAGGLGSPVLQYLASAGVGTLGIIDDDGVEASNLQRQVLFGVRDVGRSKAEVAAERVSALSPHTRVVQHRERLTDSNAAALLGGYDLVVDGTDTFETRYAVADACAALGLPLVWGSVLRFDAQATVFWSAPPQGPAVTLRDVFPVAPAPGEVPSCAEAGVVGAACGQLGAILAMEVIKLVAGIGRPLLGRMLVIDALAATTREVPLAPAGDPQRAATVSLAEARALGAALVDVRDPEETDAGVLDGALLAPLPSLLADPSSLALPGSVLVVYCQRGPRARVAARALAAAHPGVDVRVLAGGYADHTPDHPRGADAPASATPPEASR